MTRLMKALALAAALAAGGAILSACDVPTDIYYFSTSGSDTSNNCKTQSSPCRTLSKTGGKLASITLTAGDQVLLKKGDTWSQDFIDINQSGSSGHHIVVSSYGTETPKPIITNSASAAGNNNNCVEVLGSWVSIRNLGLDACGDDPTDLYYAGVTITGDNVDVAFNRIKLNHVGAKTKHGADNASIQQNNFVDNNLWQKTPSVNCANQAQAIDLEGNDGRIDGNTISGSITSTACDGSGHGSAIEVFGGSRNLITRNTVSSSKSFSEMGVDDGPDGILGNGDDSPANDNEYAWNVIHNNDADHPDVRQMRGLITRGEGDTTYGPVLGTLFKNNTIKFHTAATSGVDLQGVVCGGGCNVIFNPVLNIKNNVISITGPAGAGVYKAIFSNNADSNFNLYQCNNASLSTCVNGSMTLGANDRTGCTSGSCGGYLPGFQDGNATPPNLHLAPTSSNCGSGTTPYDALDHDYETTPQGSPDRGAYEDC